MANPSTQDPIGSETLTKGLHIIQSLRQQIVDGRLAPGDRMPTRSTLESIFEASPVTVQRAFDALIRDEFVEVINKRTYVAAHPPHLTRYALLFMENPETASNGFCSAFYRAAMSLDDAQRQKLPVYCDTSPFRGASNFQQLSEEVVAHRVAGLIFSTAPGFYIDTPILHEPGIPRVAIMSLPDHTGVPAVDFSHDSFRTRALEYLVQRGRKRIAVLQNYLIDPAEWSPDFARLGLELRSHWIQGLSIGNPETARYCTHLLMHANPADRPDAIIIADDNLVQQATAGILAAGITEPGAVDIVAHANFPWPPQSLLPVTRLGFDVRQVLKICIDLVDKQRRGEPVPAITSVPALFESEVFPSTP